MRLLQGYEEFRNKYVHNEPSVMKSLAREGQNPDVMVIACSDSRVDPALILQCNPGDLFVVRNVANIVPPYEKDDKHHGTSAALEFGICYLNVKHVVLLGHSQCGGIHALVNNESLHQDDFISNWVSIMQESGDKATDPDKVAKISLLQSRDHLLEFPWIKQRVEDGLLKIHLWFFDIKSGQIQNFVADRNEYVPLEARSE